ncbi:pyridoxamine 5'-phosphate oxidase family protein [Gracilinema caldarium]|uniref:pyridoxamine 5'-phosphate oxidase family protein n=1 Tax=Gracilinema caldarium TaxID=215591 RepID=UPI0026EF6E41|nr:pyridoxamine 5'-phosphate oxidase family protein [Gracilinema caldarium]
MRRTDREILDRRKMEVILDTTPVMHLGLWDGKEVYVVPLNFVRIGASLYFHSALEGRKIDILGSNPRVCFEVTGEHHIERGSGGADCTTRYESVIGWGTAQVVGDFNEKNAILCELNKKFGSVADKLPEHVVDKTAVIKIKIDEMTGKSNK